MTRSARRRRTPAKYFGFYPTPDELAKTVVGTVHVHRDAGEPPLRILEPSAGTGSLARLLATAGRVDCVEIQTHHAQALARAGVYNRVWRGDFLRVSPKVTGLYDRICMNPPFDRERDIDHVAHALRFLADDGILTAIMSAGTEFRTTAKSKAFRALMARMNACFGDIEPGSFASQGTNVNTILVTVRKDGKRPQILDWCWERHHFKGES